MQRLIPIQVKDEYIIGGGVVVGAKGSHNDVVLEISFSSLWDGLAKAAVFWDARKETATKVLLTTNIYSNGKYHVIIPAGVKKYDGDIYMAIKGSAASGNTETRATLSVGCSFRVLDNEYTDDTVNEEKPAPGTVEQLQQEIDEVLEDVAAIPEQIQIAQQASLDSARWAAKAEEHKVAAGLSEQAAREAEEAALRYKNEAELSASEAKASEQEVKDSAKLSESWAVGGTGERDGEDTNNSQYYANRAQGYAESMTVPAAESVRNIILQDRVTGDKYALLAENGRLAILGVSDDVDATEFTLIDPNTGVSYAVVVDNGRLGTEEV